MTPRAGRTARLRRNTASPCQAHVGTGHAQAGIEAAPERRHHGDGQEASPRMRDGAQDFFAKALAMATTPAFRPKRDGGSPSMLATLPSRTWMTRSAIVGERGVVGDEHHRLARVAARVLQKLQDGLARFVVKRAGGLVGTAAAWGSSPARGQWPRAAARHRKAAPGSCPCGAPGPPAQAPRAASSGCGQIWLASSTFSSAVRFCTRL